MSDKLGKFKNRPVEFIETMDVADGVECDVYKFVNDDSRDLGIIRIKPGCKTPCQIVLMGDETIEGFFTGKGKLSIIFADGREKEFDTLNGLEVKVGFDM